MTKDDFLVLVNDGLDVPIGHCVLDRKLIIGHTINQPIVNNESIDLAETELIY